MAEKKLDAKKLEMYKTLLLKLRDQIMGDITQITNESSGSGDGGDVSGHALHMADVATDMYDREFNMSLASNEREILLKIEDALKRIENGTFGFCLKTGKAIPAARLKAIPYAEYCLEAQEEMERIEEQEKRQKG